MCDKCLDSLGLDKQEDSSLYSPQLHDFSGHPEPDPNQGRDSLSASSNSDMSKFKVGDKVVGLPSASKHYSTTVEGWTGEVIKVNNPESITVNRYTVNPDHFKLLESNEDTIMDKIKRIPSTLKRHLNKKLQTQYKADLINGDLALTSKGERELMQILQAEFEDKLSERAEEIIKEIKDEE